MSQQSIRRAEYFWGDVFEGEPEALLDAGIVRREWLDLPPHKGRLITHDLGDGRTASVHRRGRGKLQVRIYLPKEEHARREAYLEGPAAWEEAARIIERVSRIRGRPE